MKTSNHTVATVQLIQLEKTYPASGSNAAFTAVKGINLEIASGEFMVLVGPSGCGKSTTLRMIAGLEDVTRGTIRIGDRIVNDVPPKDRDIAMVFQNYALYPHMSVYENMAFGLTLRKTPKPEIEARVREAAALLGLESLLDRRPKALSGGQRQRVAVGRAIVRKPKVFLFDEPLSNLDAKMRVQMRAEISRLHDRLGATMIYVTHDQVEAMTMGDRICVMRDGIIEQVAAPLALYHSPASAYVAGFIGSPPMNLLPGTLEARGGEHWFVGDGADAPTLKLPVAIAARAAELRDKKVFLGIRPEDVGVATGGNEIQATVELAEPMGAETIVHLRAGPHPFVVRTRSDRTFERGSRIGIAIDPAKLHLFEM